MTESSIEKGRIGPIGQVVGKGGQATVYLLPELRLPDCDRSLVYKEYRSGQQPPHGLGAIAEARNQMTGTERNRLDEVTAWPVRVVTDHGEIRGVLQPLIPDSFYRHMTLPSGRTLRVPCEVQTLFIDRAIAARLGLPDITLANRLAICRDIAAALALLHRFNFVFGDINARNELYRLDREPTVMLVDCDAVRFRGSASVVAQLNSPDWEPPDRSLSTTSDCYKLGLLILRILGPGSQASVSRDPSRVEALDRMGMRLLRAALDTDPHRRPSAEAWEGYFRHLTASRHVADQLATADADTSEAGRSRGWKRNRATGEWEPARW